MADAGSLWFFGKPFRNGRLRRCRVCDGPIRPGEAAVANFDLRAVAHLGCGGIDRKAGK